MKKIKWIIVGVIVIGILAAVLSGYQKINQTYPPAREIRTQLGEMAEFQDGILITVKDSRILQGEIETEAYGMGYGPIKARILEVDIVVENTTDQIQKMELYNMNIETLGDANAIHDTIVHDLDTTEVAYHELQPKETRRITVQYHILSNQYSKKDWKKIEEREFWLTYTLYPEKRMLMLK